MGIAAVFHHLVSAQTLSSVDQTLQSIHYMLNVYLHV